MSDLDDQDYGNDAVSVGSRSDQDDYSRRSSTDTEGEEDAEGRHTDTGVTANPTSADSNGLLQQSCRDHDTDYASECSECQDALNLARDYQPEKIQFDGRNPLLMLITWLNLV